MPVRVAVDGRSLAAARCSRAGAVKVERVLERLGGVAEAGVLQRLTSRSRVRTALARGLVVRDARGRYALPGADEAIRAERAAARGHAAVDERTARQLSQAEKAGRADHVVRNDRDLQALEQELAGVLEKLERSA